MLADAEITIPPRSARRDIIDWFQIVSGFVLTLAAVLIAWMSFAFQQAEERRTAQERVAAEIAEVELRYGTLRSNRQAYEAQAATSLIPVAINGATTERRIALLALVHVAPRLAVNLSTAILTSPRSQDDGQFALAVRLDASSREILDEFLWRLRLAREYLSKELYERACAAYSHAWNSMPDRLYKPGDDARVVQAQARCANPATTLEGAKEMQRAFGRIQTQ